MPTWNFERLSTPSNHGVDRRLSYAPIGLSGGAIPNPQIGPNEAQWGPKGVSGRERSYQTYHSISYYTVSYHHMLQYHILLLCSVRGAPISPMIKLGLYHISH